MTNNDIREEMLKKFPCCDIMNITTSIKGDKMKVFDLYKISYKFAKTHIGWAIVLALIPAISVGLDFLPNLFAIESVNIVVRIISFLLVSLAQLIILCYATQDDLSVQGFVKFFKKAPKSFYLVFVMLGTGASISAASLESVGVIVAVVIEFFEVILYYILLTESVSVSEAFSKGFLLYFENFGRYIWYYAKVILLLFATIMLGSIEMSLIGSIVAKVVDAFRVVVTLYEVVLPTIVIICIIVFAIPIFLSVPLFVKNMFDQLGQKVATQDEQCECSADVDMNLFDITSQEDETNQLR